MTRLRIATWVLFVSTAAVNACWAWVAFESHKPLLGALSTVTALLALTAALIVHLLANAYETEHKKLNTVNRGIDRLTTAVLERRKQTGPESPD